MATELLQVEATGTPDEWASGGIYSKVVAVQTVDTQYITTIAPDIDGAKQRYTLKAPTVMLAGAVVNSVTTRFQCLIEGETSETARVNLIIGGSQTTGTTRTFALNTYVEFTESVARPGGGSWVGSDFTTQSVLIEVEGIAALVDILRCEILDLTVDFTNPTGHIHLPVRGAG